MQDIRIAVRSLVRAPALTVAIVLTVGLGIGATTVMFAAANAALLRPLPYADPDRLVWIYTDTPPFMFRFSVVDYLALEAQQTQFEAIAGFTDRSMIFTGGAAAELLRGRQVSWTYFRVLGITPAAGRDFVESDGRPGAPRAVMVSHAFWRQRMGARADAVGTPIRLDAADYTVTGVLPPLAGPLEQRQEFFVAAQFEPPRRRGPFSYWMIGRLRPGTDAAAAARELHAINRRVFPLWRSSYQDERATWSLKDLKTQLVGHARSAAALGIGAVLLVWLIACANASNLLLARVAARGRELAVRSALGASRWRVLRHLLVESGVLTCGAAVIGVGLAWFGVGLLRGAGASYIPRAQEIAFDDATTWVLVAVSAISAALLAVIPVVAVGRGSGAANLGAAGRTTTGSVAVRRLRGLLVGSQFAIATPLLVCAVLLLASLNALHQVDLGFDGSSMLTASVRLPPSPYREAGRAAAYWEALDRRIKALPGVMHVGFSDSRPPDRAPNINNFDLEDHPARGGQPQPSTPFVAVTPGFFETMGLRAVAGRLLEQADAERDSLLSVVVDRAWAQRFFPDGTVVGRRFRGGGCTECPWTTVVGVVDNVRFDGLDRPNQGTVYTPMPGLLSRYVAIRTGLAPAALAPSLRDAVREIDAGASLSEVATVGELVDRSLEQPRALLVLVGGLSVVAVLLSVVGIYGVMAHYVQQSARDIGIRMALGAGRRAILRKVVGQGMTVAGAGVALGLLIALTLTRLVSGLLFGVSAMDRRVFIGVGLFLASTAALACLVPARRAVDLPPAEVLRND